MADSLEDTTVAIFLAQRGTEQVEFTDPKGAVENAGASVDVLGTETGEAQAVNNDLDPGGSFEIEKSFADVSADDYDALIIPGGAVGVDDLRADDDAVGLVGEFAEAGQADGRDLSRPMDAR